tara:strand:- start:3453 stop:3800 length:348 start_codon:yes stop_codon:yes gene_type:complete
MNTVRRKSKYLNVKTEVDGHTFDSKKEAKRYGELMLMQKAGVIQHLKLQPPFSCTVNGKLVCTYKADFSYEERKRDGRVEHIIEDVKSPITRKHPVYRIKKKLVEALYGITITET